MIEMEECLPAACLPVGRVGMAESQANPFIIPSFQNII